MRTFTVLSLLVVGSSPAYAYIDPGSGSYVLQMALAGLMALVFSIKLSWQRLKSFALGIIEGRKQARSSSRA